MISANDAHRIERSIVDGLGEQRRVWPRLAVALFAFHEGKGWEALGLSSFGEWIGQPEIGLSRSSVYGLIDIYRTVCVDRGHDLASLEMLDPSKVAVTLRAIKAGQVDVDQALADALSLSRSDLKEKYASPLSDGLDAEREPVLCPTCGRPMKGQA